MMSRRQLLGSLAAAGMGRALGAPVPAEAEPPPETRRLRLVQTPSMCQAPQYVAEDLFRAEGFDVDYVKKEGPQDIAEALASGEADVNLHFSARLVVSVDRGAPLVILAGVHPGCYELFTAQPLRTLRELKGKTVAIRAVGGPEHVFLSSMAAYVGLEPAKDITWVTYPAATSIQLLAQGSLAALSQGVVSLEVEDGAAQAGDELGEIHGFRVAVAHGALPLDHSVEQGLAGCHQLVHARPQLGGRLFAAGNALPGGSHFIFR